MCTCPTGFSGDRCESKSESFGPGKKALSYYANSIHRNFGIDVKQIKFVTNFEMHTYS